MGRPYQGDDFRGQVLEVQPDGSRTAAEVAGWLSVVIEGMLAEGEMGRSEAAIPA